MCEDGSLNVEKYYAQGAPYAPELDAAERGDIEPLRSRLKAINPRIAKFVNLPRRNRGKRWPKVRLDTNKRLAVVEDIRRIRALWILHYGKKNRRADDGPSAEAIAAKRWGVKEDDVLQWLKKSPAK